MTGTEGEVTPKSRTQPLLFIWKTRRGTEGRRRTVEGNAKLFTHCLLIAVFIKLRKFFAHCLLIAELIKLRKFFTHCQLKEVFIKLKQVSEIIRKLKKIILV